jgi:cell division protein FtsB
MISSFRSLERAERWQRRLRLVLKLGLVLWVLWIAASFLGRELEIRQLRDELSRLDLQKAKILKEIEELQTRLQNRDDLKLLEYLARKELGMVKPGEEVYFIIESDEERAREP